MKPPLYFRRTLAGLAATDESSGAALRKIPIGELVTAGVLAADPAEREQIYFELQQLHHDSAIQVTLLQSTGFRFEQRWVQDWFFRVGQFGSYYYAYSLAGGE